MVSVNRRFRIFEFPQQYFPDLKKKEFSYCRECGKDLAGLIRSIVISFIEQLIHSQNTPSNNIYHIEDLYFLFRVSILEDNKIKQVFSCILNQSMNHPEFHQALTEDKLFQEEVNTFCKIFFNFSSEISFPVLYELLNKISENYNLRISLYSNNQRDPEKKFKKNIHGSPLKIFIIQIDNKYYTAYKENYATYYKEPRKSTKKKLDNNGTSDYTNVLIDVLDTFTSKLEIIKLSDDEKLQISDDLDEFYKSSSEMKKFDKNIRTKGIKIDCGICRCISILNFKCGCSFCYKCIIEYDFNGKCIKCGKLLLQIDQDKIIYVKRNPLSF